MNTDKTRCPFEIGADENGTFMKVTLPEDSQVRDNLIYHGLKNFYEDFSLEALSFILPPSLQPRHSENDMALQIELCEYQAEIIGNDLAIRLYPFMPEQFMNTSDEEIEKYIQEEVHRAHIARALFKESDFTTKQGLIDHLHNNFAKRFREGVRNPGSKVSRDNINLLSIIISGATIEAEKNVHLAGKVHGGRNCFQIVRTPYYPEIFPRYAENIEIVLTKIMHIDMVPLEAQTNLKIGFNKFYRANGVKVDELINSMPSGLWIPQYAKTA